MIGQCLADRYELRSELGQGGMAVVYRALDRVLGREVAVKVVSTVGLEEAAIERFQREARLVGRLDHPAVVPIYDFGRDGEQLFFVMPVLEGATLYRLLRERPPTLDQTLEILARVAEALDHSATRGVVHRDVKPENVMVALGDGPGAEAVERVWVMDFGLALGRASSRITQTGNLPGTLAYLSPEQVLSARLDGRSDLYSLGVILYECLTGRRPFSGSPASVLYRIVHEPVPPPEPGTVDPSLVDVLQACLEKKPEERMQSGADLGRALREASRQIDATGVVATGPLRRRPPASPSRLPLIGRDEELGILRRRLDRGLPGNLQFVAVSGHPGQGKTRLLEALEDEAHGRGAMVLHGRWSERESTYPYQAFCELIQDYFRQVHDTGRSSSSPSSSSSASSESIRRPQVVDLSDLAPDLVAVFPSLAEVPEIQEAAEGVDEPSAIDEAARLYELVARTLGRLAAGRPAVLLLEHLHAADASIELIRYLLRRLSSAPILVAATYRQGSAGPGHPLLGLLRGLRDDPCFEEIRLGPLSESAHRELVEEILGGEAEAELARRLYSATEGNPYFSRELLRSMLQSDQIHPDADGVFRRARDAATTGAESASDASTGDGGASSESQGSGLGQYLGLSMGGALPDTIQHAVQARLERLAEMPRKILDAASVLGRQFAERELEDLLASDTDTLGSESSGSYAVDEEVLESSIESLLEFGLLEEERANRADRLRFVSGLVRDVVYSSLPRRRRRRLHRRHAEALERRSSRRIERVAHQLLHHFAEGDLADKAIHYGRLHASRSLDTYCWDDALYACDVALDFAEDEGDETAEADLRLLRARALAAKGRADEALREGRRTLELSTGDADRAVEICRFLAETAWRSRRISETRAWLDQGIALARRLLETAAALVGEHGRDAPRRALAELLGLSATVDSLAGEAERARRQLDEASELRAAIEQTSPAPPPTTGGTLRLGMTRSVTTFDPAAVMSAQDIELSCLLFEPLLRPARSSVDSGGSGEPGGSGTSFAPCLGPSWSVSDDGLSYRFRLDPERRFSDGTRLTAEHVRESFAAASRRSGERRPAALDAIVAVETPADDEVVLRLEAPLSPFPALLSDPRTAVALRTDSSPALGTGPFRVAQRNAARDVSPDDSDRLGLERNPHHPNPARLDRVEVRFLPSSRDLATSWRGGAFDLVRDLAPDDALELLRHAGSARTVETPQNNVYFALLHPDGPRTRDPRLRRILATAMDPRRLVWSTVPRFAVPMAGWLPPGILGHDPAREPEIMGRTEAVTAMDEYRPLPVRLVALEHPAFTDQYRAISDALFGAWKLLGCEVERRAVPMEDLVAALQDLDDVDIVLARWWPDYPDPDGFFYGAFHSRAGLFRAALAYPELDAAMDEARRESDPAVRERLYRRLEDSLIGRHVLRPLFHDLEVRLASPRVADLETWPLPPFVDYVALSLRQDAAPAFERRRSGRLVIPLGSKVRTLDPAWAFHADAAEVSANVFETLTRLDEGAVAVPHLARELHTEDGGRTWRCTLRVARFHDGRRLGARDVRASFRRLLRHGYPDLRTVLEPLEGAAEAMEGRGDLPGVVIAGERRLEFRLTRRVPHFPALLSNAATAIVPEGTREFGDAWRPGTVGTGPFRLVSFTPGRRAELVANEDYRVPELPKAEELVFELGIEPKRAADGFVEGDFSMLSTLAAADLEDLSRRPEYAAGLAEQPAFNTYFATLTATRGPLADDGLRRQVADILAGTRPELLRRLGRLGQAASRLIPPSLLGLAADSDSSAGLDPGDARQETQENGGPDPTAPAPRPLDGLRLTVALHPSYGAGFRGLWRVIRGALEDAGVEIEVQGREFDQIFDAMSRGEIDLVLNRWIADIPDPSSFAQVMADGPVSGQWQEPEIGRLAARATAEDQTSRRHRLYQELDALLTERAYLVPLFHEQSWRLVRPGICGLRLRYGWPEVVYEELSIES